MSFILVRYPFVECAKFEGNNISVSADPANFILFKGDNIYERASIRSGLEFKTEYHGRKLELPHPETIAVALGIVKSKVADKLSRMLFTEIRNHQSSVITNYAISYSI